MSVWTEREGTIWIETRREGLLSPVGHDLRLEVGRFTIEVDRERDTVRATVKTATVRLRAALDGDQERPGSIGGRDQRRIERKIADDVLKTQRHPQAVFEGSSVVTTATGYALEGSLTLRGVTRPIAVEALRSEGRLVARVALRKSDFGIRQVSALLGTLKVRDVVHVVVDVPEP